MPFVSPCSAAWDGAGAGNAQGQWHGCSDSRQGLSRAPGCVVRCCLPILLFLCHWMSHSVATGQQHWRKHFLSSLNTHGEVEKPSTVQPSAWSALHILLLRIPVAANPSGAPQKSEAGCDPIAPWAAPRGTDPAMSHPPGSPVPAQVLEMVPQEKSLMETLPCTLLICCEPEALGRVCGGLVSAWHCHQHPAPSAHFTQVIFLRPGFQKQIQTLSVPV